MPSRRTAKVALCTPVYAAVDPLAIEAHHWLVKQSVSADGEPLVRSFHQVQGRPVAEARNALTVQALQTDATHLLWIDADMTYNADSLERLLDRDLPIVGGLCYNRAPPYQPIAARRFHASWAFDPYTIGWIYDHPREGLLDVDVTGGAFLLVRRDVYEAIHARESRGNPQWSGYWSPTEYEHAEDFSFCHRAKSAGFEIKIDCSVRIGHVGRVVIDEDFSRRNRTFDDLHHQPMLVPFRREGLDEHERPTHPIATVVIPTYNQKPEFLRAAVLSALNQTWPVEVLVVDDGSAQPVDALLADLIDSAHATRPVRVVRHAGGGNHGIAASMNRGIKQARTDWICWLSSDDLLVPHKVQAQWLAMNSANAVAGFHGYNVAVHNGQAIRQPILREPRNMAEQQEQLARSCYINGSTTMIHRSVFSDVGLYDTSFRYSQDWEMWNRIGRKYEWHYTAEALGIRREIDSNQTQTIERAGGERRQAWREEDERIRAMYALPNYPLLLRKLAEHADLSTVPAWLRERVQAALNPAGQ